MKKFLLLLVFLLLACASAFIWQQEPVPDLKAGEQYDLPPAALSENTSLVIEIDEIPESVPEISQAFTEETGQNAPQLHTAFEYYSGMSVQDILVGLFTDPDLQQDRIELLLQLIEHGFIGANQPLRERGNSQHYTPLFAALASNHSEITAEQFQRFIDAGAVIDTGNIWMRALSRIRDSDVIELWFNEARIGPEQYQRVFDSALQGGNPELADHIFPKMGGDASLAQLSSQAIHQHITNLIQHDASGRIAFDMSRYDYTGRIAVTQVLEMEIRGTKALLGQITILSRYAELNLSQLTTLSLIADKVQQKQASLQKLLADYQ